MLDKYKKFLIVGAHTYLNLFIKIKNKKLIIKSSKIN